jgi:hypothetical protein
VFRAVVALVWVWPSMRPLVNVAQPRPIITSTAQLAAKQSRPVACDTTGDRVRVTVLSRWSITGGVALSLWARGVAGETRNVVAVSDLVKGADNSVPSVVGGSAGGGTSWPKTAGAGSCARDGGDDHVHVIDWLTHRPIACTHIEVFGELNTLDDVGGDRGVHVLTVMTSLAVDVGVGWVKSIEATADRLSIGMVTGEAHGNHPQSDHRDIGVLHDDLDGAFGSPYESTSGGPVSTPLARNFPTHGRHSIHLVMATRQYK